MIYNKKDILHALKEQQIIYRELLKDDDRLVGYTSNYHDCPICQLTTDFSIHVCSICIFSIRLSSTACLRMKTYPHDSLHYKDGTYKCVRSLKTMKFLVRRRLKFYKLLIDAVKSIKLDVIPNEQVATIAWSIDDAVYNTYKARIKYVDKSELNYDLY